MSDYTSRKFIELIFMASSKWANWNPPYDIKVGDYGKLDAKTGEFNREGNVYVDMHIYEDENIYKLVISNPAIPAPREDVYIAASTRVTRTDLNLGAEAQILGLADASIKGQWSFGSKRGALLIMANPRCSYIPPATLLKHLVNVQALKDMVLVTEVFCCPAYSFYLSSGSNEVIDLALVGSFPVPQAPGVTAGGEAGVRWWVRNTNGLFRSARDPLGKDDYTPLYMVKEIRKKTWFSNRRGGEPVIRREGDDLWSDVQLPWGPLNEEGEEENYEDTVFED